VYVANPFIGRLIFCGILLLHLAERPGFIALKTIAIKVASFAA
jgi:hypothetical protein